eukprot:scaffold127656_cov31-Tisochrysis_lutea.AAC.2
MVVIDGLDGSFEHANMMERPFLLYAWKGAKPPAGVVGGGAPLKPIIAIASMGGAECADAGGPPPSKSSRSMAPPAAGGGVGAGAPPPNPVAAGGAGAEPPRRSPRRSMSETGAGAAGGAAGGAGAPADTAESLLPPPPSAAAAAACRSFFAKAGMRSSTPARMESSRRSEMYSTERCWSSSDMEPEKALSCSCINEIAR